MTVAELVERARQLAGQGKRRLLGITGAPGAGKSTVARAVVDALGPQLSVLVPMDGFHLANVTLVAWGRRDRKGAWDTFDADGFVHLLRRLRDQTEEYVHAPDFYREIEESIGSARPVHRDVPLVVTEGNYLLSREGAWPQVAGLLDETWYLDVDPATRRERLVRRHEQHGKTHAEAEAWTDGSDEANATLIAATRARADLAVTVTADATPDPGR
jgi:pantothenate kinase